MTQSTTAVPLVIVCLWILAQTIETNTLANLKQKFIPSIKITTIETNILPIYSVNNTRNIDSIHPTEVTQKIPQSKRRKRRIIETDTTDTEPNLKQEKIKPVTDCSDTEKVLDAMMTEREQRFISSYITPTSSYFEWGSGGSTDTYARLTSGPVVSVENYQEWCDKVSILPLVKCRQNTKHKLDYKCIVPHPTSPYGYPTDKRHNGNFGAYISAIANYTGMDIVLVDGRWRVACALMALNYITDRTVVFMHDVMKGRRIYDDVHAWYDVVAQVDTLKAMVRKKNTIRPTMEQMNRYATKPEW